MLPQTSASFPEAALPSSSACAASIPSLTRHSTLIPIPCGSLSLRSLASIRIFDLASDLQGIMAEEVLTVDEETLLERMQWTEDGQLLSVSSSRATVYAFLSRLPLIGGSCSNRVAFLSSLTEVSVHSLDSSSKDSGCEDSMTIRLETEPSVIAVSSDHVAAVMNNKAWFYSLTGRFERCSHVSVSTTTA